MATQHSFEQLRNAVASMGPLIKGSLADRVDDVLDRARVNADDTVYVEKSSTDWNRVALDSLRTVLTSGEVDRAVIRWFKARGIEG